MATSTKTTTDSKTRRQIAAEKQAAREAADIAKKAKAAPAASAEDKAATAQAKRELREAETARRKAEKETAAQARAEAKANKPKDPKAENPELWAKAKVEAHTKLAELSRHLCACGCGAECRNTFAPGHDAKLASRIANERFAEMLAANAS